MTLAAELSIIPFGSCGSLHARAVALAMHLTERKHITGTGALLIALYVLATAHIAEAVIYAVGFFIGESAGIGGFAQADVNSFIDVFYFSVVNYSSLGLGDIYPTGHLGFLAGIEVLNGFLLISCSASTTFLVTT